MKAQALAVLAALLVFAVQSSAAQAATRLSISPASTIVNPGNEFSVDVDIDTDDNVYAIIFELSFEGGIANGTSIDDGSFLKQGGTSIYVAVRYIDNDDGKIIYAVTRVNETGGQTGNATGGANGQGTIATINFESVGTGISGLDLGNVEIVNVSLEPVSYSTVNGNVRVNWLPSASNLDLTPSSPQTDDDLASSYDFTDPDDDPENASEIRWYRNGELQPDYDNQTTLPASATAKGQAWHFTVRPGDSYGLGSLQTSHDVTIQNTVPSEPMANVTPDLPKTGDDLLCTPSGSTDADGDTITYSYEWYKDGFLQPGLDGSTVSALLTAKDEVWLCKVTPSDGTGNGDSAQDDVNVQNTAPVIDTHAPLSLTLNTREGNSLQFKHTSSDADLDGLTYSWKLDSVEKATTANWTYSPAAPADLGARTILLTVSDGFATDTETWTVTVKLRGDVDGDKDVDIFDLAAAGLAYGSSTGGAYWNANADMNPSPGVDGTPEGDGTINIMDLAVVGVNWGRRY